MEAKLRAWLESKGKTKSAQRLGPLNSPLPKKTPSSIVTPAKRSITFNSSVKKWGKTANLDAQHTNEKKEQNGEITKGWGVVGCTKTFLKIHKGIYAFSC